MPVSGQLTKDKFGYSIPVDSPLYTPFPLYYEDVRILMFPYLTDAKAAAALVPSQFELVPADPQGAFAIAEVVFAHYPFSNIGAYNEVAQVIAVSYKNQPGSYAVRLHVTNDQAMAAGREIGGFPKKLGHISFDEGDVLVSILESPKGLAICSGELAPMQPVMDTTASPPRRKTTQPLVFFSLRVIPNPEDARTPSVCQIIQTEWVLEHGTFWSGRGALHFTGASGLNPYHALPVLKPMPPFATSPQTDIERNTPGTGLFRGGMSIAGVKVLESF